jgi:hypothetical protein
LFRRHQLALFSLAKRDLSDREIQFKVTARVLEICEQGKIDNVREGAAQRIMQIVWGWSRRLAREFPCYNGDKEREWAGVKRRDRSGGRDKDSRFKGQGRKTHKSGMTRGLERKPKKPSLRHWSRVSVSELMKGYVEDGSTWARKQEGKKER